MTPQGLILTAPGTLDFEPLDMRPLIGKEVRVRTLYSGVSAGTELTQYRGTNPWMNRRFDDVRRIFVDSDTPSWTYPIRTLGYEEVGEVIETGPEAKHIPIGQHVYGTWNHKTHAIIDADYAEDRAMPKGADPQIGIFSHIGAVALNGVHDAGIRLGDVVAVFGLGVLGQIVAQAARASGAYVIGIDPDAHRRQIALDLGAQHVLAPAAAEAIKDQTGGKGADICIEVSGSHLALADAIRSVAYASRVVAMGFYQGEGHGLFLGDEFHHNRIELICSQISGVAPAVSHRWSKPRLWRTAVELQHQGILNLLPLISHRAPFAQAPQIFEQLHTAPGSMLQAVLEFDV